MHAALDHGGSIVHQSLNRLNEQTELAIISIDMEV